MLLMHSVWYVKYFWLCRVNGLLAEATFRLQRFHVHINTFSAETCEKL